MSDETYTPSGVSFDGLHSYTDFGLWLMSRPSLGSPEAKISIVDIPGADGNIDLTEANTGEVKYSNRTLTFEFGAMVAEEDQEVFRKSLMNYLHGKRIQKIVLDEDPDWYWTGRASVEFSDVQSWRLRCTVTVDAAPYAMKMTEETVDLTSGTAQLYDVVLAENSYGVGNLNSNFILGTADFPNGIPEDNLQVLYIKYPPNAPHFAMMNTGEVQIIGIANGADVTYSQTIQYNASGATIPISFQTLEDNGIVLSGVYRVLVSRIGNCELYVQKQSVKHAIQNERKSVLPEFSLGADDPVTIVINGLERQVAVGVATYDDIVLRQGTNEIYIPTLPSDVVEFTMRFREGKL